MVYQDDVDNDYGNEDDDATLASELLVAGVHRSRVKGLFHGHLKDSHVDQIAESVMAQKLKTGTVSGAEMPEIKQLVREAEAPKELLDPLFMHLMTDPVVLSSGLVMDRSSVHDEDGELRFKRCPITRVEIDKSVYPLLEKKEQIKSFKRRRDRVITEIAQKLISNGSFKTFGEVLEAVEDYLKDLGDSNYLPLARELAAIWTGIDGSDSSSIPLFLFADKLKEQVHETNRWYLSMTSGIIDYEVGQILVAAQDLGYVSNTRLALVLHNEKGTCVERCELFRHSAHSTRPSSTWNLFDDKDPIVHKASKGFEYRLEYIVMDGHNNNYIDVEGLICKIFPETFQCSRYRMQDQNSNMGLFMGSVDSNGRANGKGSMEYDDGKRFVGQFSKGVMSEGVLYKGSRALFTMKYGKWSKPPSLNKLTLNHYPQEVAIIERRTPHCDVRGPPEVRETRQPQKTRNLSPHYDSDSLKYHHHEAHGIRGTNGTRDMSPDLDYRLSKFGNDFSAVQPDTFSTPSPHQIRRQDIRPGSTGRHEKHELAHIPNPTRQSNLGKYNGTSYARPTVPVYVNKREKHQDEISQVTKNTLWNDAGSLGSDSPNGEHERGIVREGEKERLSTSNRDKDRNTPIFLVLKTVKGKGTDDEWQCAMESGHLLSNISKVLISVHLKDNHRCSLALSLYNARDHFVERLNITENLTRGDGTTSYFQELTIDDNIVSRACQGSKYKLEYVLGNGGSSEMVHATNWICKIFPVGVIKKLSREYEIKDQNGKAGIYMVFNSRKNGNELGVMEYYDGKRFVGEFNNDKMVEGVLYDGANYLGSIIDGGPWDTENKNQELIAKYPQQVYILNSTSRVGIC